MASTNMLEWLNEEIRRRTRAIGIILSPDACISGYFLSVE